MNEIKSEVIRKIIDIINVKNCKEVIKSTSDLQNLEDNYKIYLNY